MASLKELRARIGSVKSTRKITSAMKMVAAAKLRRAETRAAAARPYADAMRRMLAEVARSVAGEGGQPALLTGTGQDKVHLLIPMSSDRGLAGAFNSNINRTTRNLVLKLQAEGKTVKILPVGRKTYEFLSRDFADLIIGHRHLSASKEIPFSSATELGEQITSLLEKGEFDVCTLVYNRFQNVMTQTPTEMQIVPLALPENDNTENADVASYEFEPDEATMLSSLLPRNLQVQLYATMLETAAGENGARMTAMDNATRNAGKAIDRLTLTYNRTRQTNITNELIEIISGAQAV
ncbi:F0F1 ATP synthase subunit gamma [Komagataeibacter oboediens]|uniref:ATP synthase gamma chain n=1 Tax=Komagataeibacter oboediens TaxID=65958 RepID=A0A318QQL1_9PROT|nr:F0F1 ATP synthase subunit gamma [Komagataeibacter oboediens]MBL7232429.1 F0F1 ATP synthase subunit gamma [Komagataeibacter oboediens]MBT0674707.1 F0F1 ATP synthase subunit gamma [Komagataeibacter oboediens]MBT0677517.1 F0F1 ATP synthase subunit gamma [Komagataeibacter oboediens]MBV0887478.1 F0F1 ATP synthase subunit gamma [Komagataeibacter oboediens]MBV1824516.1 F0F1 ATP synthase subunit gamma [Komagataeibacter oboediens]